MTDLTPSRPGGAPPHFTQVGKGALVLSTFQILGKFLLAVFFLLLGNRALFSEMEYGRLETLLAWINLFLIPADLGIEALTIRKLAHDQTSSSRWLPGEVTLKLLLTLLTGIFLVLWLLQTDFLSEPDSILQPGIVWGCLGILVALSGQSYVRSISRAHDRMSIEGWMFLVEKTLTLGLGFMVLWLGIGLVGVLGALTIGSLAGLLWAIWAVSRIETGFHPGWPPAFSLLKQSFPFALSAICVSLFYNMDRVMLGFWSPEWVASYGRALRINLGLLLLPQAISIAIYPAFSRLSETPTGALRVGRSALQLLMFYSLPVVCGGIVLAGPLMDLLFGCGNITTPSLFSRLGNPSLIGNQVEADCLKALLVGLPFTCLSYLFGPALNAWNLERSNLVAGAWTAVFNIILNLILIPTWGALGAAVATALTQILYSMILYLILRKRLPGWWSGNGLRRLSVFALFMGMVLMILPDNWPVLLLIPLGITLFLPLAYWCGCWPKRDW